MNQNIRWHSLLCSSDCHNNLFH